MMKRISILAAEIALVAVAVFASDFLKDFIKFVPHWIVKLPGAAYSQADFWLVLQYFLVLHLLVLGVFQLFAGPWRPGDSKRTVDELFAFAAAFALSALTVFVTTTVAFDPQFMVGIAVCAAVLVLVVHAAACLRSRAVGAWSAELGRALLRRVFSVAGVLTLVLALSPGVLAMLFVKNRDVANVITQIRITLALSADHDWHFENALAGAKFKQPILVQFPPHRDDQIYILERNGRILRMPWGAPGEPEVVLDIADGVGFVEVENGALGFDFHPNFGRDGAPQADLVYVYYTSVHGNQQLNYLSSFSLAAPSLPERARSEQRLIIWDRGNSGFHNGGSVEFGPDGFLYVAIGEMSFHKGHQRIDKALTSGILRIDVDRQGGSISHPPRRQPERAETDGYYIPSDNPFVGEPGVLEEFWALGLRNPFRISFDTETGDLWAGEVGSATWEEVNLIRRGHNYQFPFIEGRAPTGDPRPETLVGIEAGPVYTYRHTAYDRAAIGGVVYRGSRHAAIRGRYVFGDNYSGRIFTIPASGTPTEQADEIAQANQFAQRGIASFAVSPDGELLVTTLGRASGVTGEVLKLVAGEGVAGVSQQAAAGSDEETVSVAEAKNLYNTNCGRCHGTAGDGDGPDGPKMNVPMPDFGDSSYHTQRSDEQIYAVIENGGAANGLSAMMPPWGQLLSRNEIDAMVRYIRSLQR